MHFLLDPLDAKHGFGHKAMLDFSANIRKECFDLPWTVNNHGNTSAKSTVRKERNSVPTYTRRAHIKRNKLTEMKNAENYIHSKESDL
jgi:hypothetical protein